MRAALPDFLPIVAKRLRDGGYGSVYAECELSAPTDLCDARGRLNPAAVGWSRTPLVRANTSPPVQSRMWLSSTIGLDFVISDSLRDL